MSEWCSTRTQTEVVAELAAADAAVGPVMDMADIGADPHIAARGTIAMVGDTPMQALIARLSATPGVLRWPGRPPDADGDDIRTNGWTA
jgi:crotonobetainyl-CoA:carnitine CoA-transferase CaiB-like acyl-CoA transferase